MGDIGGHPDYQHAVCTCLVCGAPLDGSLAVEVGGRAPEDGDVTLCGYCGALGIYADGVTRLRPATAAEWDAVMANPDLRRAVAALAIARARATDWPTWPPAGR